MLKQQNKTISRSVHPYQTTVVPRTELQLSSAAQQRAKFPWAEGVNTPVYQVAGTDSSTSENAYHVLSHTIIINNYFVHMKKN